MTFPLTIQRDPTTGRYILYMDASLYKSTGCLRRVWYTAFRGLRQGDKDFKMEFGTATHKFLQLHYAGKPLEESMAAATTHYAPILVPDSDFRHIGMLVNVCQQYHTCYSRGGDTLRAVDPSTTLECKFAYPFYQTDKTEVLLCGTIDMIGMLGSRKVIVDHKTTSLTQVESYLNSYQLSPQLMLYKLIYQRLFNNKDIGCMINGIFLSKSGKTKFERSMIFEYTELQLCKLERHVRSTVVEIVNQFESLLENPTTHNDPLSRFPENYTCCDEKFGMCQFSSICSVDSPDDKEAVIGNSFTQKQYNPLKFSE